MRFKWIYLFIMLLIFPNITFAQLQFSPPTEKTDSETTTEPSNPRGTYPEPVPSQSMGSMMAHSEMNLDSFSERLAAAHQFLESASPLFRDIIKNGFQSDFIGFTEEKVNQVLDLTVNRFKENVILLSTLAKHFSARELTLFADFFKTKEVISVVKKVNQELVSEDQQFEQDFEGIANEINTLLKNIPELLRNQ